MAKMHMLANKNIDSSEVQANLSGRGKSGSTLKTACARLLRAAIGAILIYIGAKMLRTAMHFLWVLVIGSNSQLSQTPSWIRWAAKIGNQVSEFWIDFKAVRWAPNGLLEWITYLIWSGVRMLLNVILNAAIYLLGRVIVLLPTVLSLSVAIVGFSLLGNAIIREGAGAYSGILSRREREARERGKEGERIAMEQLALLPDDYHVFGNLQFEYRNYNGDLRPGEADFLVVGPTGLHLVEVKHWTGSILRGSNERSVVHVKTNGETIEEKSPFFQSASNAGKLGNLVRRTSGVNVRINANVFFTDDALDIDMAVPAGCAMYKGADQLSHRRLTQAICRSEESRLTVSEEERIVGAIMRDVWKPEYSAEVMHYLRKSA